MKIFLIVLVVLVLLCILYIISTRNALVVLRNKVKDQFSQIDIQLKRRFDLIPNLVEVVKEYEKHEKETFSQIANLRTNQYNSMPMNRKIKVNEQLTPEVSKVIVISERYPELKSNENFLQLSRELVQIEDEIANSRKYYNGAVRILNTKIQIFPNNIVASIFGFKQASMFEANTEEKNNIGVEL